MFSIRARVRRGAKRLDKANPEWRDEVDGPSLQMWSPYRCVLGQSYGDFLKGIKALGMRKRRLFTTRLTLWWNGFIATTEYKDSDGKYTGEVKLANEWRKIIG